MKMAVALVFMILSNIFLLAHAAIPHEHHHSICLLSWHGNKHSDSHKHKHGNTDNNDANLCALCDEVMLHRRIVKAPECNCVDKIAANYLLDDINLKILPLPSLGTSIDILPNFVFPYLKHLSSGLSLRGPPGV